MCTCQKLQAAAQSRDQAHNVSTPEIETLLRHLGQLLRRDKSLSSGLHPSSLRELSTLVPPASGRTEPARKRRTAPIFQKQITFVAERTALLSRCTESIESFWTPITDTSCNFSTVSTNPLYSSIKYLIDTSTDEFHKTILRRCHCVLVFIASIVSPSYDETRIVQSFHEAGVNLEQKELRQFRNAGRRYLDLSLRLGGVGAIWFLPIEAPRSVWENEMPRNGIQFVQIVRHLDSIGVSQEAAAIHDLAARVLRDRLNLLLPDFSITWGCELQPGAGPETTFLGYQHSTWAEKVVWSLDVRLDTVVTKPGLEVLSIDKTVLLEYMTAQAANMGPIWITMPTGHAPIMTFSLTGSACEMPPVGRPAVLPHKGRGAILQVEVISESDFRSILQKNGVGLIYWNAFEDLAFINVELIGADLQAEIRGLMRTTKDNRTN